ncbi:MAG: cell division protein FtsK, partial [Actinophytocola sp.]|nr:cell division protein FtsK [Actinophytocola sp.]
MGAGAVRWVADAEGFAVRLAAVRREDAEQYLRLSRQHDARVRLRTIAAGAAAAAGLAGAAGLVMAPEPVRWAGAAVLIAVLGVAGAPSDRPLVDRAVVATRASKLTSDVVVRALGSLGLAGVNKAMAKG